MRMLIFLILISGNLFSQMQPVVVPAANSAETADAIITWSIGQTFTGTCGSSRAVLAQGNVSSKYDIINLLSESKSKFEVSVFPNPVADMLNVKCNITAGMVSYYIADIKGNKIISGIFESEDTAIECSTLSDGVYFIIIDGVESFKIVKK